jgi:hypothetical protein
MCNPQDWWRAARTGTKDLLRRSGHDAQEIRSIAVSSVDQMAILVDNEGKVLAPVPRLLQRERGLDYLYEKVGERTLRTLVNADPAVDSLLAQVLYLMQEERRAWHDAVSILPTGAFLRYQMTDRKIIDRITAAKTGLYSQRGGSWSKQLLMMLGIRPSLLPSTEGQLDFSGRITETAAEALGVPVNTPVINSGTSLAQAILGWDLQEVGDVILEIGAGGHLVVITDKGISDRTGRARPMPHPFRDDRFLLLIRTGVGEQSLLRAAAKYDWPGGADLQLPNDLADSGPEGTYTDFWSAWAERCAESIGHLASLAHLSGRILLTGPLATPDIADRLSQAAGVNISMVHDEHLSARADTILANMLLGRADDLEAARAKVNLPEPVALEY